MLFNSTPFIFLFLPLVLTGCFILAEWRAVSAQLWLIAASLFFYTYWNPRYLPLLLLSIGFNYLIALGMTRTQRASLRWSLMVVAVVVNLGLLGYYKYTGFLVDSVNQLAGTNFFVPVILLPLGISFYTFQQLTLLVDISSGETGRFRLRDFVLFVIFFPHLIAGPIVHHREMMPQFERARYRFDWGNMAVGVSLFAMGLFKKAVLADGLARSVSPIYAQASAGHQLGVLEGWAAAIGFMLQVYFDFSGYSEMALGLARMVGIKLPMNFNSPLKATSMIDFWSRWHITLTRFLTAYVYSPIAVALTRRRMASGKRGLMGARTTPGAVVTLIAVPTIVTMFLSGLWHGAGAQFLVWGLLHGCFLVVNHAWRFARLRFWRDNASYDRIMDPLGWLITFVAVMLAAPFFRADSVTAGANAVAGMIGLHGIALPQTIADRFAGVGASLGALGVHFTPASLGDFVTLWCWIAGLLTIAIFMPNVLEIMRPFEPAVNLPARTTHGRLVFPWIERRFQWRPNVRWAAATAILALTGILTLNQTSEFLYWQF